MLPIQYLQRAYSDMPDFIHLSPTLRLMLRLFITFSVSVQAQFVFTILLQIINLLSSRRDIFLVGGVNHQIVSSKLPSNRQVLSVLFYNLREAKHSLKDSVSLTILDCMIIWEKARKTIW